MQQIEISINNHIFKFSGKIHNKSIQYKCINCDYIIYRFKHNDFGILYQTYLSDYGFSFISLDKLLTCTEMIIKNIIE